VRGHCNYFGVSGNFRSLLRLVEATKRAWWYKWLCRRSQRTRLTWERFGDVLSADDAQQVLQHVGAALTPGGRLFIIGQILDETHTTPREAVGFNLIFLNTFYAGESYTEGEHRAWLQAADFVDVVRAPFLLRDGFGPGLIIAYKREEPGGTRT
jgi:hypothetical protein